MSRIGRQTVPLPNGVKATPGNGTIQITGPLGQVEQAIDPRLRVVVDDAEKSVRVERTAEDRQTRALHGLTRSLIANMVEGCEKGYSKAIEVYGVGYGVQCQGNRLTVTCGMSHPVVFEVPEGLTVVVQTPQARGDSEPARFSVSGADKQAVGELAARVRKARPPEPYKGKGIRYAGEKVRRKVGKAFAGGAG